MSRARTKAKLEDAKSGHYLYIRLKNQWNRVEVCETKLSPKGVKVEYRMEDGTQGSQLLTAFYSQIPDA